MLAVRPSTAPPNFFSFADPFHFDIWIGVGLAYILVTLSFTILGRMGHKEWINPYPCAKEPKFLINQFTFKNSVWFSIGALMQQGTEIAPRFVFAKKNYLKSCFFNFVIFLIKTFKNFFFFNLYIVVFFYLIFLF